MEAAGGVFAGIQMRTVKAVCDAHGEFEQAIMTGLGPGGRSMCPACRAEKDRAEMIESDKRLQAARDRLKADELARRMAVAGIPERFRECSFAGMRVDTGTQYQPDQERAIRLGAAYVDRWESVKAGGKCLILTGPPGTGKTHLACAVGNGVLANGGTVAFGTVTDYVREVRAAFRRDSEKSEKAAINEMRMPDLLIMDELGQRMSEFDQQVIFDVINGRYSDLRPMILMSNLTPEELSEVMGERMMSRLSEVGSFIRMDWPSWRGRTG